MAKKKTTKEEPVEPEEETVSENTERKIPETFADLPYHVRRMLNSVERHQMRVKELVEQVEDKYGLSAVVDDENWTWSMQVDQQGAVAEATENGKQLIEYLNRK